MKAFNAASTIGHGSFDQSYFPEMGGGNYSSVVEESNFEENDTLGNLTSSRGGE